MSRWLCLLCCSLLLLGFIGCTRTPASVQEPTPEEEQRIEDELRRRVEKEGEGSTRRADEKTQPRIEQR